MSAYTGAIQDREYAKFVESPGRPGQTAIEVLTYPAPGTEQPTVLPTPINIFDEALAVTSGIETLIVSYPVPAGMSFFLSLIQGTGNNIATYRVKINGETVGVSRTWFGTPLDCLFNFANGNTRGLEVDASTTIEVYVLHNRPDAGDFSARILGVLENE